MRMATALVALLVASSTAWTQSQVPERISFQGRLTNASGQPLNGNVSVTFRLYTTPTGGTALWTEAQSVSTVGGVYTAYLGQVNPFGSVDFSVPYWLSVEVASDGEMTPRYMLSSSPYALRSAVADALQGLTTPISQLSQLSGINTNVTAANLNLLTSGGNADSLHSHSTAAITNLASTTMLLSGSQTITGPKTYAPTANVTGLTVLQSSAASPTASIFAVQNSTGATNYLSVDSSGNLAWVGTASGSISGNAATVTNGLYSTGSYADPAWLTALSGAKVAGDISGNASNVTGIVSLPNGGTGAATAAAALGNLGGASLTTPNTFSVGGQKIQTGTPSSAGLVIQGTLGQTANLQEWRDQTGALLAAISPAGAFTGSGSNLTSLNASNLTAGTVPSSALGGTYSSSLNFTNTGNVFAGSGSSLTSLNASNVTQGTLPSGALGGTYSGAVTFTNAGNTFTGSGAGLTALSASAITSGILADVRLSSNVSFLSATQTVTGANTFAPSTNVTGATVRQTSAASPTVDVFSVQNSAGSSTFFNVTSAGQVGWSGTASGSISGNAATVTNGLVTTGSYADPAWITSLSGTKISGPVGSATAAVNAASLGGVPASSYSRLNLAQTFSGGTQTIQTGAPGTRGLVLQAAPGQTANLLEWQDSTGTILGSVSASGTFGGTWQGAPVGPAFGGTGFDSSATPAGSLFRTTGLGAWATLGPGTNGQVLTMSGGVPTWSPPSSSGGVSSISQGTGIALGPNPITGTGTVAIDTTVVPRLGASNTFTAGLQSIQTGAAANLGLVISGVTGQTANLQEWRNSTGTVVASVGPAGILTGSGAGLTGITSSGLSAGTYANAYTFSNASNAISGTFSGNGSGLTALNPAGLSAGTAAINISGNAASVTNGVVTTGTYSDPAWISALSGAKISGDIAGNASNVNGIVGIPNGGTGAGSAAAARANLVAAGSGANSDITSLSGLSTALSLSQGGTGASTAPAALAALGGASLSASNTYTVGAQIFQTGAAGTKGLIVKGAASQTANLQEWQDSTGVALASISASGAFSGSGASLSGLNASNLSSGTVPSAALSGTYAGALTLSNAGNSFSGSGAGLVGLNASTLSTGTVPLAALSGSYSGITGVGTLTTGTWNASAIGVSFGGTGASTPVGARANLGVAASGANSDITSLAGLTTALSPAQGGTNATSVGPAGAIAYSTGAGYAFTATGTAGQVLESTGAGTPLWAAANAHNHAGQSWTASAPNGLLVTNSSSAAGSAGLRGESTDPTAGTYGIYGQAASTSGSGLYGAATATSGFAVGVTGQSDSTGGYGIYGTATATSGSAGGVRGDANGDSGTGVSGNAFGTGTTFGVQGQSTSSGGRGVFGWATSTIGLAHGVLGQSDSNQGRALSGTATSSTGATYGAYAVSASTSGTGVFGQALAATGTTYGVYGTVTSASGFGLYTPNNAYVGGTLGVGSLGTIGNFPKAHVYLTSSPSIPNGTETDLSFDAEDYDTANILDPGKIWLTAPVSGYYRVYATVQWATNGGGIRAIEIWKDLGGSISRDVDFTVPPTSVTQTQVSVSRMLHLNAGDSVKIVVLQTSGAALTVLGGGTAAFSKSFVEMEYVP